MKFVDEFEIELAKSVLIISRTILLTTGAIWNPLELKIVDEVENDLAKVVKSIGDEVFRFAADLRFLLIRSAPLKTIGVGGVDRVCTKERPPENSSQP